MSEVKERPIIFSGEMVRAILDGRKTMTRRVVKPQPYTIRWCPVQSNRIQGWQDEHGRPYNCPYGVEGAHLWVRERWGVAESSFKPYACTINYFADNASKTVPGHTGIQYAGKNLSFVWRPSIHMPRWASRITLEITGVRVERLQEISEEDAIAEGMQTSIGGLWCGTPHKAHGFPKQHNTAVEAFSDLWNSLNAKRGYGWDANPWVWVVAFRRVEV